jgi:hypothetical protein
MVHKKFLPQIAVTLVFGLLTSLNVSAQDTWPPKLPTANKNGVATLNTPDLLKVPAAVQHVLDSTSNAQLTIAKAVPTVEVIYHDGLPNAALNGTGWSSWGDICVASNGKVYSGIGNHWKTDRGQSYVYSWDPNTKTLTKVADLNKISGAGADDVHFSKVHAHIIEGRDKKIYFTGTLDDGGKAESEDMMKRWNTKIGGGKLFQYDPATGKSIVYADFPKARVTATTKYDPKRNILYCSLEGSPDGFAFGAFDMTAKKWIYNGPPAEVSGQDRNFMLDSKGNIYFNGVESAAHTALREKNLAAAMGEGKVIPASMLPGINRRINKVAKAYTTLWKYDPTTNKVTPTNTYFTSIGFRSSTVESKEGYIYGSTMGGEMFRYSPSKDKIEILSSNFLIDGEYITVCDLSPDEKYVYYLPGAHGSAGFSGTPVIQYDVKTNKQKAIAFLNEPMNNAWHYAPGGTYGMKVSKDGSKLYIGLNGAPSDNIRPKELHEGFGLTSFAVINIPASER